MAGGREDQRRGQTSKPHLHRGALMAIRKASGSPENRGKVREPRSLIILCCRSTLMKSKVLKPRSRTSWFSHSRSSLAVWDEETRETRSYLCTTTPALLRPRETRTEVTKQLQGLIWAADTNPVLCDSPSSPAFVRKHSWLALISQQKKPPPSLRRAFLCTETTSELPCTHRHRRSHSVT